MGHRAEGDRWRREELTVNYRTPSQIAAAAESMAIAHGLPVTKSVAVRESEWPIDTVADVVDAVRLAQETRGTVAVIATDDRAPVLLDTLDSAFPGEVGIGAEGLDSAITVLGAHDAKGLEFDAVVIVDPAAIVHATERGAAALFVAMTRPTQRLVFADAEVLPAGL
ncbi:DNA helicase IV [Cryobacterium mesophilum]|nr:DNA helicase IV [Terrimesophilobacter mesophilus]